MRGRRVISGLPTRGQSGSLNAGTCITILPEVPHLERIRLWLPLNAYDRDPFYTFDARGYTDYPFYEQRSESRAYTRNVISCASLQAFIPPSTVRFAPVM
jgi:hypothetical protein